MSTRACSFLLCLALMISSPMTVHAESKYLSEEEVMEMAEEVGEIYGISPYLLTAIAYQESRYKVFAKNGSCKGMYQVSEKWHKDRMERLEVTDLYDPYGNMLVAADLLSELNEECEDMAFTLDSYHGDSKAQEYYKNGKTSSYVRKIMDKATELETQY